MAKAITRTRHKVNVSTRNSRTANVTTGTDSPFRSHHEDTRVKAAEAIIQQRLDELAALKIAVAKETNVKKQRVLATRILATSNNIKSWVTYLGENAPHSARAVIVP